MKLEKNADLKSGIFSSKILWLNISFIYGGVSDLSTLSMLVINTTKTKLMLITTHQRRTVLNTNNLILSLNNEDLNTIDKDKILGVSVDNN